MKSCPAPCRRERVKRIPGNGFRLVSGVIYLCKRWRVGSEVPAAVEKSFRFGGIFMRRRFENSRRPADFRPSLVWLAIFILFTLLVAFVNRQPVGPQNSVVGFADFNLSVHEAIGTNKIFYILSKILGILAILLAGLETVNVIRQCIQRGGPDRVAADSLALMVIYTVTVLIYILFEFVVINYRPVLDDGQLAASYPSSHSLLAVAVFLTAAEQMKFRIRNSRDRLVFTAVLTAACILTILTRFLSGVHWITDIIGGILAGFFVLSLYRPVIRLIRNMRV